MTAIVLFKRMGVIAGFALVLALVHIVLYELAPRIASSIRPDYVPMTAEQLDGATRSRGKCQSLDDYFIAGSVPTRCTPAHEAWQKEQSRIADYHRQEWNSAARNFEQDVTRTLTFIFVIGYLILLMRLLGHFSQLFTVVLRGRLRKGVTNLKSAANESRGALKDALDRRRLHQAEQDFLSLKTLFDNGLISEEVFSKRKKELAAALAKPR